MGIFVLTQRQQDLSNRVADGPLERRRSSPTDRPRPSAAVAVGRSHAVGSDRRAVAYRQPLKLPAAAGLRRPLVAAKAPAGSTVVINLSRCRIFIRRRRSVGRPARSTNLCNAFNLLFIYCGRSSLPRHGASSRRAASAQSSFSFYNAGRPAQAPRFYSDCHRYRHAFQEPSCGAIVGERRQRSVGSTVTSNRAGRI